MTRGFRRTAPVVRDARWQIPATCGRQNLVIPMELHITGLSKTYAERRARARRQ